MLVDDDSIRHSAFGSTEHEHCRASTYIMLLSYRYSINVRVQCSPFLRSTVLQRSKPKLRIHSWVFLVVEPLNLSFVSSRRFNPHITSATKRVLV